MKESRYTEEKNFGVLNRVEAGRKGGRRRSGCPVTSARGRPKGGLLTNGERHLSISG